MVKKKHKRTKKVLNAMEGVEMTTQGIVKRENSFGIFNCSICQKKFNEQNNLVLHEKRPHFWSCTERGCSIAFATKTDRVIHEEEIHKDRHHSEINTNRDHLVMNPDGTMSFNKMLSLKTKRGSQRKVDVSKLAQISDYGGNRGKNGLVSSVSYRKRPKNEKWNKVDTSKFYKNLSIYGCNFALLAALFRGRSRKQLKNKYKKEERQNPNLIKNALTNRQPMDLNMEEFEEIVTENLQAKQTFAQMTDNYDATKRKAVKVKVASERRKANKKRKVVNKVKSHTLGSCVSAQQPMSEPSISSFLELSPPLQAVDEKDTDSVKSDYEFDPFA